MTSNTGRYSIIAWRVTVRFVRNLEIQVSLLLLLIIGITVAIAVDEDSGTLFERGILNFFHYQKIMLSDHVYKVEIDESGFQPANVEVALANRNVHGILIFENNDESVHRIIFKQHIGNDLSYEIKSPVIEPGEKWALDILKDGIYPYQCTLHPDRSLGILQVWYEEEDIW